MKLGVLAFGRQLIETEDLDPIYVMLWKARLPEKKLYKWLLAYWWFYSAKTAIKIAFSESYYKTALWEAENKGHRATERRHFRGSACIDCIKFFHGKYPKPWEAIYALQKLTKINSELPYRKGFWPQFGPWIWFKVRDMLERLNIVTVKFPIDSKLYDDPAEGASLAARRFPELWSENQDDPGPTTEEVVALLIQKLKSFKAPPRYERHIGLQEVETILCKWKSHRKGHYYIGKDTKEIRESLTGETKFMRKYLPKP